jgi:hypothetical protein
VEAALDELRDELGSERLELSELVVLGAQAKLGQLRTQRGDTEALRRELANRIRSGTLPVDRDAADEVRRSGWAR